MRIPLVAANWKMNMTVGEALHFFELFLEGHENDKNIEIVIAPPYTALLPVKHTIGVNTGIGLAAQDLFWEEKGAFTGAISPMMIRDVGCSHVIIGHSERRTLFNETDETVNKKLVAALKEELIPIICVGETLEQRDQGKTLQIIKTQLKNGLEGLNGERKKDIIIAYEPVWAIGTGRNATPGQAQEVHAHIRSTLSEEWGEEVSSLVRIVYGGSVNPGNSPMLMREADIDGALVGGASMKPDSFREIINSTREAKGV